MASDQIVQPASGEAGPSSPARDSVFANRDFARLWAGQSVSLIGHTSKAILPTIRLPEIGPK